MSHDTSNPSGNQFEPRPRRGRRSTALLAGALVLGGTAGVLISQPGGAAARYPAPTEAEARQSALGWTIERVLPERAGLAGVLQLAGVPEPLPVPLGRGVPVIPVHRGSTVPASHPAWKGPG